MWLFFVVFLLSSSALYARKSFTPDYFIKKHNLVLPEIPDKSFDITDFTHDNDKWTYSYFGSTNTIKCVKRHLNIQGLPSNYRYNYYTYSNDTTYIKSRTISEKTGDTLSKRDIAEINKGLIQIIYNPDTKCTTYVEYTTYVDIKDRKMEKKKCPGDEEPTGQEFSYDEFNEYIESIETYRGKVDSSSIRRLYLTSFDSLAADYMLIDGVKPVLVELNIYNKNHKVTQKYTFGIYAQNFKVTKFEKYIYTTAGNVHRVYLFMAVDRKNLDKGYKLANYTEYEYDNQGRLATMTTRVIPDPKYKKKNTAK